MNRCTSLMAQLLRPYTSTAGGVGSIPGGGTKQLRSHMLHSAARKKKNESLNWKTIRNLISFFLCSLILNGHSIWKSYSCCSVLSPSLTPSHHAFIKLYHKNFNVFSILYSGIKRLCGCIILTKTLSSPKVQLWVQSKRNVSKMSCHNIKLLSVETYFSMLKLNLYTLLIEKCSLILSRYQII